jgi:hypothetical protein
MVQWIYKVTKHRVDGQTVTGAGESFQCDEKGSCLVHDMHEGEVEGLKDIFNSEGREGWELIQCHYHDKDLICMWKKKKPAR